MYQAFWHGVFLEITVKSGTVHASFFRNQGLGVQGESFGAGFKIPAQK
jgi:hypothetical protein